MTVSVIGDAYVDLIFPIQDIKPGETHHRKIIMLCGGTANVSVQVSLLGEKSKFVGKVGHDVFGKYFIQNLRTMGVKDIIFVDKKKPTGLCISMTYNNGERSMVANRGANDNLRKEEIISCLEEITSSKIVYFSGYSLLSKKSSENIFYAIKECYKKDCKIYFNPGAPNLIKEDLKKIISDYVDVLILNMDEAKIITKRDNIDDISKSLSTIVDTSIITMSEGGCIYIKGGGHSMISTKKLFVSDTTGAGDAFSAGFIVGRLRNLNEFDCAKLGNQTALGYLKRKQEL